MKDSRFGRPSDSPGYLLWQTTNAWQRQVRAALVPLGLTHVQFVVLASITWFDTGPPPTQREIAAFAGTDEMMTSQAVRALESKGLVTRARPAEDRRRRVLAVTEDGRSRARAALSVVESADASFFAGLGEQRSGFLDALRSLTKPGRA